MRSTPQRWFSWFVFLSFAVILAVAGTAAAGRDLGLLADTLSSNFFAQQVSTICSADNPRFQQNAIGKLGDASAYASLVKREIVMNLPASEAEALVREASQSARSEALELLKRFSGGSNVNVNSCKNGVSPLACLISGNYNRFMMTIMMNSKGKSTPRKSNIQNLICIRVPTTAALPIALMPEGSNGLGM
jgi:hypothetical protein